MGDLRQRQVTPHIAINRVVSKTGKVRTTAIDARTTRNFKTAADVERSRRQPVLRNDVARDQTISPWVVSRCSSKAASNA